MEIRLSSPDQFIDAKIDEAAKLAGCWARIKWWMPSGARFVLVERAMSDRPASFEQHDDVIARLFMHDPCATIRTAKAIYHGAAEFQTQKAARVA